MIYVATATADDEEMVQRIARHRAQRPPTWQTLEVPQALASAVAAELRAHPPIAADSITTAGDSPPAATSAATDTADGLPSAGSCPRMTVIIEDLTLLLSNLMAEDLEAAEARALGELGALLALPVNLILVSNEVGMGLVPPYPLGRVFRDALGRLNQSAATACSAVYILFAGLPVQLK